MKYQKKPVTVEAFQWIDTNEHELPDWLIKELDSGTLFFEFDDVDKLGINTLEGVMKVSDGDFVIQGVHGEIYSCKPDIFEETYVKVDDTDHLSPDDIGNDIHEFLHGGDK